MNDSIRFLSQTDIPEMVEIYGLSFDNRWNVHDFEQLMTQSCVFALGFGVPLKGFIVVRHVADESEIITLAVSPPARGNGIATNLLCRTIGELIPLAIAQMFIEVAENNKEALGLYFKFGFKIVSRRQNYYNLSRLTKVDALVMALNLSKQL